jgi:hypothetical protein
MAAVASRRPRGGGRHERGELDGWSWARILDCSTEGFGGTDSQSEIIPPSPARFLTMSRQGSGGTAGDQAAAAAPHVPAGRGGGGSDLAAANANASASWWLPSWVPVSSPMPVDGQVAGPARASAPFVCAAGCQSAAGSYPEGTLRLKSGTLVCDDAGGALPLAH